METVDNILGINVVEKALLYANHEWYATEKNVMHLHLKSLIRG